MNDAREPKKIFAISFFLTAITAWLFWPLAHYPFIVFDDAEYIYDNPNVTSGLSWANFLWAFHGAHAANWHPLTWLSHQLDCTLFGLNAGRHHLVNVLLHIANSLLVFLFLRGATGAVWRSAVVAALFAWHPLHVESVAWASERKDTLSTLFWLLTLMAYVRFAKLFKAQDAKFKVFYAVALICFALGLMSKPMVVTLPFVLLLLDFWPLNRISFFEINAGIFVRLVVEKIPFFLMAIAGSAATYFAQTGAMSSISLGERLGNALLAYARYVVKFFWPDDLGIVYSHPPHTPWLLALGALALLLLWTIPIWLNRRERPFLAVGWFWFLGTLVPTIGLVQVGAQSMADRYTYIPSIGFFLVIVWGGAALMVKHAQKKSLGILIVSGILVACLTMTAIQISYWRDSIALFRHTLEVSQDNYLAANSLGKAYERSGDKAHALVLYQAAVESEPYYPQSQFNLAMTLLDFGDETGGLKHLQIAAKLQPSNPDIQYDLGIYFGRHTDWPAAAHAFSNSLALRPDFSASHANLAGALANLGDFKTAAAHYREALRLDPQNELAKSNFQKLLQAHPEFH